VRRLTDAADVFIEGFRPGVMERLGLGPDELRGRNARLVYARMTGWGQDGPWADRAGHDINYVSLAGPLAHIGRRDQPPETSPVPSPQGLECHPYFISKSPTALAHHTEWRCGLSRRCRP
jgi:crotonobetainyl-CoA:carnitine CoA-transferase CaiB-like acyl-CoA transferase